MDWYNFKRQKLQSSINEVVENAIIKELNDGHRLKICIGCDSQVKGKVIDFATVVLILREKKGGFMYFKIQRKMQNMSIKERMITEVGIAVSTAF
jgi:predicted RNase H-related nuclease YkuK (DUF458 family)